MAGSRAHRNMQKSEGRNPKTERRPKAEIRAECALSRFSNFGSRPSFGLRVSAFHMRPTFMD